MNEEYYKTLIQLLPDIVFKIDPDGIFTYLNDAVMNLGYSADELLGKHFSAVIHPDDLDYVKRDFVINKMKTDGTAVKVHPKLFDERRTGSRITKKLILCLVPKNWDKENKKFNRNENFWEVLSLGLYNEKNSKTVFIGSIGVIKDIRNLIKSEESLLRNIRYYRSLIENSSDIINIIANDGTILFASSSVKRILGYEPVELIGNNIFDYIELKEYNKLLEALKADIQGQDKSSFIIEVPFSHKNGNMLSLEITGKRVVNDNGDLMCYILNSRDVTERNNMIEELIHSKRIDSIRTLAGGIAHDFNNLLTSIIGNISIARLNVKEDDINFRALIDAEKASLRARDLTLQLLAFSKGGSPIKKITSIKKLLVDTANFVLSGSHISIDFDIEDDLLNAYCDEGQISQMLHNLILNSIQAMENAGKILITAKNIDVIPAMGLPLKEGGYIKITVEDEGCGIEEENLSKIFDPFFTTKKEGTGLGLSVTNAIIDKHNGHIAADSKIDIGTTFTIFLPGSIEGVIVEKENKEHNNISNKRVLLMDDDDMILEVCGKMLAKLDCRVTSAKNGQETIKLYKEAKNSGIPFDVVIMDLTIPGGMGGREVIKILKDFDPGIKAIVSSGYSNDPVMSHYREFGFSGVTPKPYNINDLEHVIGEVLN